LAKEQIVARFNRDNEIITVKIDDWIIIFKRLKNGEIDLLFASRGLKSLTDLDGKGEDLPEDILSLAESRALRISGSVIEKNRKEKEDRKEGYSAVGKTREKERKRRKKGRFFIDRPGYTFKR